MNVLVSWLVAGVGVALVATITSRTIPSGSPAARHAFWWLVLAAILAVPFLPDAGSLFEGPEGAVVSAVAPAPMTALTIPAPPRWITAAGGGLWALVAVLATIRLVLNLRAVRRLSRQARPLPAERLSRFHQFAEATVGSRRARVYVSDDLRGACAVGFTRARILISSDLVATLDDEAIEAIVLHEYAHLQRYDDWSRLLQQFAKAVTGLHPAVRWVCRQIDVEREAACDRIVVSRTGAPVAYGKALAAAAEIASRMSGLTPFAAPGAPISGSGLHARIRRLLEAPPVRPAALWASTVASAVALIVSTATAANLPPLVTVASLDLPLLELASVPVAIAHVKPAPQMMVASVADATPQQTPAGAQNDEAAAPVQQTVLPSIERAGAPERGEGIVLGHEPLLKTEAEAAAPSTGMQAPLASVPLSHSFAVPGSGTAQNAAPEEGDGIGTSAARLGVKTGDAAARAGNSIGRFFKRRGLAIANSF